MNKPLWLVVWLLMLELIVILLLIPGDWTERAIHRESALIEQRLGEKARTWIEAQASRWYQLSVIDSGVYESAHHMFIPTQAEREKSKGMEQMGKAWFGWVEGRIKALAKLIYQFCMRLALLASWAPYLLILLLPALYDGLMTWKIKRTNFDYASPVIHRYSLRGTGLLAVGLFIAFFAPFALDPVIIPITMMVCCVLIGLTVGNFQKRV